jgi:hypothetical protein
MALGIAGPALAEDVLVVDVATFEAGRFVIAGTAPAGVEVRVEGTGATDISDPVSGRFRIARRTVLPSCSVTVAAGALSQEVPVANCRMAMLGIEVERPTSLLRPRGPWISTRSYRVNDVVEWDGRDFRAVLASEGRQPAMPGNVSFWEELPDGEDPTLATAGGAENPPPESINVTGDDMDPAEADLAPPATE